MAYVGIWAAWGWLPVTLAYITFFSARSLRQLAHQTVGTTIPKLYVALADKSSQALMQYLDGKTFTVALRRKQAEELVALWLPRIQQTQIWLQDPNVRAVAEQWLSPVWWSRLQTFLDSPLPADVQEKAKQTIEVWIQNLETVIDSARQQGSQPLTNWLTTQTQTFLTVWYRTNISPHIRTVLIGYRIWLAILSLWALSPWLGWLLLASVL